MKVVGIDPGTSRSGVALVIDSVPQDWRTVNSLQEVFAWIRQHQPDHVVCEDYILMGENRIFGQQDIDMCKMIGRIHQWCLDRRVSFSLQRNSCKDMGATLTGKQVKKSEKNNDAISALNHAVWFCHTRNNPQGRSQNAGRPPKPTPPWKRVDS